MAMEAMQMKTLLTLLAVLFLIVSVGAPSMTASAETGPYTLVLVTRGKYFVKAQTGTFETLNDCTAEGAKLIVNQNLYLGFACVLPDDL
jgi:hypothetical protein